MGVRPATGSDWRQGDRAGIRVESVNAAYTSQTCHACNRLGRRDEQAEFVCPHDDCHVSEFQADINAAANIASRVNPWGESVRWEPGRNDSPQDGSGRDTATVHREPSEKPSQMTLTAYSDWNLPARIPHAWEAPSFTTGRMSRGFERDRAIKAIDDLRKHEGWEDVTAVENRDIYAVDGNALFNRPSHRLVESLAVLQWCVHPDATELTDATRSYVQQLDSPQRPSMWTSGRNRRWGNEIIYREVIWYGRLQDYT